MAAEDTWIEAARAVQAGAERYGAGDLAGAAEALERALRIVPDHPRARSYLGWVRRCQRLEAERQAPPPLASPRATPSRPTMQVLLGDVSPVPQAPPSGRMPTQPPEFEEIEIETDDGDGALAELIHAAEEWSERATSSLRPSASRQEAARQEPIQPEPARPETPPPAPVELPAADEDDDLLDLEIESPISSAPPPSPPASRSAVPPASRSAVPPASRSAVPPASQPAAPSGLSDILSDQPLVPGTPIRPAAEPAPAAPAGRSDHEISMIFSNVPLVPMLEAAGALPPGLTPAPASESDHEISMIFSNVPLVQAAGARPPGPAPAAPAAAPPSRPAPTAPRLPAVLRIPPPPPPLPPPPAPEADDGMPEILLEEPPAPAPAAPAPSSISEPALELDDDLSFEPLAAGVLAAAAADAPQSQASPSVPPARQSPLLAEDLFADLEAEDAPAEARPLVARPATGETPDFVVDFEDVLEDVPDAPLDLDQALEDAQEALDHGRPDDAYRLAEALIGHAGGDPGASTLRLYQVRLAKLYEALLGPLDRVPHARGFAPDLEPASAFLLSLLDGTMTLDEALTVSGMDRLRGARSLYALLRRGLLTF